MAAALLDEEKETKIYQYRELLCSIKAMQELNQTELKTLVNLGAEFYIRAKVRDPSRIYVDIGLGFYLVAIHFEQQYYFLIFIRTSHLMKQWIL
jgi:prefoldin subunit 5